MGQELTANGIGAGAPVSAADAPVSAAGGAEQPAWMLFSAPRRWGLLAILFLVSTSNYVDRNVIAVLLEPIKHEFQVSDTALGLLGGFCFAIFYAVFGMPVARWADRGNRRTIITLALTVWSIMTLCCGLAQSFVQLAVARIGVGAGESGAIPPAQSLIADYFPPAQRARAIAIFTAAAISGYLLGFGVGGYIAATRGWRTAFLAAALPGLVLAVITRLCLAEPRRELRYQVKSHDVETTRQSVAKLMRKRSYVYALIGCLIYFFVAYGALIFIPSYLIRTLHVPLERVSVNYGAASALASAVGTLGGGWLADRLAQRDVRWLAWLPAFALLLTAPLEISGLLVGSFEAFIALGFLASLLLAAGLPPVFAAIHVVCGNRRRATAIAIVLFSATLFGGGFGPLVTGVVSDFFTRHLGADGLRYSLITVMPLLAASGGCFYAFARAMPKDIED
ncbi:MAG TPA: MFS transporter [Steroidobacteraceae bacterium]|nr:MFS transporter [Steroidobacteraceae bacterium]